MSTSRIAHHASASCPAIFSLCLYAFMVKLRLMQSHEVLREVFHKCSAKQIAADLDLSLSLVYKWAEPPAEDGPPTGNPLERVAALYRCSHDERILQWLCQQAGGFYIKNPKTHHAHPDYLIPATNQIVQEFADLLAVIATAAADNQITPKESKTIRARWEELKSVTETFVACCEDGNFAPLKDRPGIQTER
jgi:hypothetical protein